MDGLLTGGLDGTGSGLATGGLVEDISGGSPDELVVAGTTFSAVGILEMGELRIVVCPPAFTQVTGDMLAKTIGRKLIPVIDAARDIKVMLGLRPYTVKLVKTRWQGGKRGAGPETVVSVFEILPVPMISDLTSLRQVVNASSWDEAGGLFLSEISGAYTEDQLRGLGSGGQPAGQDEQFYYEIEFHAPGVQAERRRCVPASAPTYQAGKFQWLISLERQVDGRARNGQPR